ncbi:MAG: amidohydrolase [Oscillibacter sp.]|jgi:predicted amidohydrolase YtcJ|nr:amidohydrolase [Oscillibacter sp.]
MKTIYYNAKVYVERGQFAQAVATEDGLIKKVGGNSQVLALADHDTVRIDCKGRTLLPGLNDSHLHFMQLGESMYQVPIDGVSSIGEMIRICREFMTQHPERVARGIHAAGWNQDLFTDSKRMPDRHDLDKISTEIPIVLERVCGHILSTNTKAIEMLGLTGASPHYPDGDFLLGDDGEPNGIFTENACNFAKDIIPDFTIEERRSILMESMDRALSYGLTSVQSNDVGTSFMDGPAAFRMFRDVYEKGQGKLRYRHQVCFNDLDAFRKYLSEGEFTRKYAPDSWLTIGPLKLFKDGSLGARTALMKHDYADDPGNRGLTWIKPGDMDEYCRLAREHGVQVVTHCIGDEAVEETVAAYEKAFVDGKNKLRHALVHCQITDRALIDRIVKDDILVIAQPIFLDYDMHIVEDRCGRELSSTSYAFGSLHRKGAHVSYSTDCPVESCNPFPNIYMAVTRKDKAGRPEGGFFPQECVDVATAVDAYTQESAYAEFMENRKGRIRENYYADLVLLDRDIFTVDPMEIKDIRPLLTVVGGKIMYRDSSFSV